MAVRFSWSRRCSKTSSAATHRPRRVTGPPRSQLSLEHMRSHTCGSPCERTRGRASWASTANATLSGTRWGTDSLPLNFLFRPKQLMTARRLSPAVVSSSSIRGCASYAIGGWCRASSTTSSTQVCALLQYSIIAAKRSLTCN